MMKIRTKFGQFELEAESTLDMDNLLAWAKEQDTHAQSVSVKSSEDLIAHVRANPGYAAYWLTKKCGFDAKLIRSEIRAGNLQVHETLYTRSKGRGVATTDGIYTDGVEPVKVSDEDVAVHMCSWMAGWGPMPFDDVVTKGGVVKSQAKRVLKKLILSETLYVDAEGLLRVTICDKVES